MIEEFGENLSAYQQGSLWIFARVPIFNLNLIKAFKVLKTSGSYWRGDVEKPQLTRIYAISYPDKKQLKDYLFRLQEAQKREPHFRKKIAIIFFSSRSSWDAFFQPKGIVLWEKLWSFGKVATRYL